MPAVWNLRVKGWPVGAVRVDRSTPWGNPFVMGSEADREWVCNEFEDWIKTEPALIARAKATLRGKDLLCWCAPKRCHADTWLRLVND